MERFGEWYAVQTGPMAGQAVLAGWQEKAIANGQSWVKLSQCPRCFALVAGNQWGHERWHANTDFPIPPEVLQEIGGVMQEAAKAKVADGG